MAQLRKLAVVGHGKMGRMVEQLAPQHGFEVALILNSEDNADGVGLTQESLAGVDVAIEFSSPHAVVSNLRRLAALRVPTVTGTTGWSQQQRTVENEVKANGAALLASPNFSVGVAVFDRLTRYAAKLLQGHREYGAWAWEIHHDAKKDAPSGTLLHLVENMKQAGFDRSIDISASRAGRHPGTHEVGFDSAFDTITLRHAARGREGFASGALQAAAWLIGRTGVYSFQDCLFGDSSPS